MMTSLKRLWGLIGRTIRSMRVLVVVKSHVLHEAAARMMEKRAFGLSWFSGPGGGFFKPGAFVKAFWGGIKAAKRVIPELAKLSVLLENWERVFTVYNTNMLSAHDETFCKTIRGLVSSGCIGIHINMHFHHAK